MSGRYTPLDGINRQDSMSSQELDAASSTHDDVASSDGIPQSPTGPSPVPRSGSSLTVENLRIFEEATERSATGSPLLLRSVQESLRTSSPLGPVKNGPGSPVTVELAGGIAGRISSSSRPNSQSQLHTPSGIGVESLRTGSSKPLPPIGVDKLQDDGGNEQDANTNSTSTSTDKTLNSSEKQELSARSSQPRILSYRRERSTPSNDLEQSLQTSDSITTARSERSVSFKDDAETKSPSKSPRLTVKSPALREVVRKTNTEGKEIIGVSIATETEWSWLESLALAGKAEVEIKEADQTKTPPTSGFPRRRRTRKGSQCSTSNLSETSDGEMDGGKARTESVLEDDLDKTDVQSESEYSDDDVAPLPTDTLLPSIGPPRIIQYQRESDRVSSYPDSRGNTAGTSGLPRKESFASSFSGSSDMDGEEMGGVCEFCQQELKTFPTPEMAQSMTPDEIYCCTDYQQLVEFTLTHSPEAKFPVDEMIDIQPHAPYGSKQARRAAKERAAQRMRDREIARQRASGANQANFYAFARQMKTINYQLSSQKCLDEGWTIRPPSPNDDDNGPPMVFQPEPVIPSAIMLQRKQGVQDPAIVKKFYEDGQLFMLMFPDGTGNVFYPSGHIAILITSVEKGQYSYFAFEDMQNNAPLLAMFQPNGSATCYHSNRNIRLNLDQYGGILADQKGGIRKKWSWKDQVTHVHAPPFQPICFAINKMFSVRCMGQDQIFLTFNCNMQSIRFNVGVKLKLVAPQLIPEEPIDDHALYISEVKAYVQLIFDKIDNIQKFGKSPKLENLRPSLRLQHNILRNEQMKTRRNMKYVSSSNGGKDPPVVTVN